MLSSRNRRKHINIFTVLCDVTGVCLKFSRIRGWIFRAKAIFLNDANEPSSFIDFCIVFSETYTHTHSYRFTGWLNRSNLYALPSNLFTVVDSFFVVSRGSESKWLWVCLLLQFENTLRDASLSIYKEHTQQSNSRINKWKKRQRQ